MFYFYFQQLNSSSNLPVRPTTLEVILDAEVFGWKNSYENPSRDLPQPPHGWRPIHRENIIIVPNTNHVSTRPTSANRWLKAHLRFFRKKRVYKSDIGGFLSKWHTVDLLKMVRHTFGLKSFSMSIDNAWIASLEGGTPAKWNVFITSWTTSSLQHTNSYALSLQPLPCCAFHQSWSCPHESTCSL